MMPLQPGYVNKKTKEMVLVNVCTMLANFCKPTQNKPALLGKYCSIMNMGKNSITLVTKCLFSDHDEVETFFHEFGHVMHQLCSQTETSKFNGTHVERDFVEAPSQMLENWCWEEETLKMMSGHYVDNSEIPKDLIDKLIGEKSNI